MTFPVYDLFFGPSGERLAKLPRQVGMGVSLSARAGAMPAGWCGGEGPAIAQDEWPRSPVTGFPMLHLLTLLLPTEYRRKGEGLVAISLFQADDHVARPVPGVSEVLAQSAARGANEAFTQSVARGVNEALTQGAALGPGRAGLPFYDDLARARRHPNATPLRDIIGGSFALLWLSAAEFHGPRVVPPADHRAGVAPRDVGQNLNAWDHARPAIPIFLVQRAFDPNAGKTPTDDEDTDYVDVICSDEPELKAFFKEVHGRSHLGGTCMPMQAMPEGLTPWFLELEDDVGGANFGGGNMQLDLESGVFDWAC